MSGAGDRLVSVIVPAYDRRYCVMDAVGSVLAQTYRHVECIVVDDGSVDGTFETVAAAGAGDRRVRVFAQGHAGVSAARNRGLREARGEYVTFLDSDDLMPPTRVQRQVELLAELACGGVFGRFESFVMEGATPPAWMATRPEWCRGHAWTSLLTATARVRAVGGFDETLLMGEDADLLVRLREAGVDFRAIDELFVVRRFFGDNLTYGMRDNDSALRDAIRRRMTRRRAAAVPQ